MPLHTYTYTRIVIIYTCSATTPYAITTYYNYSTPVHYIIIGIYGTV